jgi:hypothetical protein
MRNGQACPTAHVTACQRVTWGYTMAAAGTCCSAANACAASTTVLDPDRHACNASLRDQATGTCAQVLVAYAMVDATSVRAVKGPQLRLSARFDALMPVCPDVWYAPPGHAHANNHAPAPCSERTSAATSRFMLETAHQHGPHTTAWAHPSAQAHCRTALSCLTVWLLLRTRSCCARAQ